MIHLNIPHLLWPVMSCFPHSTNSMFVLLISHQAKVDSTPAAAATGMKPMAGVPIAPQSTKITAPPLTGIGKSESHK